MSFPFYSQNPEILVLITVVQLVKWKISIDLYNLNYYIEEAFIAFFTDQWIAGVQAKETFLVDYY